MLISESDAKIIVKYASTIIIVNSSYSSMDLGSQMISFNSS
jgi:hypothetical protein